MENIRKISDYTFNYEDTVAWDCRYDVVVIGFGGAGAPAAAAAADAGAKVLLLEKAPKGMEGGNARVSAQHLLSFTDYDEGVKYLKSCRYGLTLAAPDEYIEQFVAESMKFGKWWNDLGYTEYQIQQRNDFPFPGGSSAIVYYTEIPGTQRYWSGLRQLVLDRLDRIELWYESPACALIQDPFSKTVLGVKVKTEGRTVNVRALNGVVMASGGFEENSKMLQDYGNIPYPACPDGMITGDGINMAIEVGAAIGRMGAISGPYPTFTTPDEHRFMFHMTKFLKREPGIIKNHAAIIVGPDGKRFYDESTDLKHGDIAYHGNYRKVMWPVPSYVVMDKSVLDIQIHAGMGDNNEEGLKKGYIITGDSIEELAGKLDIDAAGLADTIARYNGFCAAGEDTETGRKAPMVAFTGKGYCAMLVTPGLYNTTGGPDRNLDCEMIATDGKVIPHLYGCGDLGGYGIGNYHGGFGLVEAWYTGLIAGRNAAKAKAAVPAASIKLVAQPACGFTKAAESRLPEIELGEDEYIGSGEGMYGPITVKLTYKDGAIKDIKVLSHKEDEPIGGKAMNKLIPAVIAANSPEVDTVSSATLSSNGFLKAVKEALEKAR